MKKLLSAIVGLVMAFGLVNAAGAKTIQVSALEDFNTANPPAVLHVQMNANTRIDYYSHKVWTGCHRWRGNNAYYNVTECAIG